MYTLKFLWIYIDQKVSGNAITTVKSFIIFYLPCPASFWWKFNNKVKFQLPVTTYPKVLLIWYFRYLSIFSWRIQTVTPSWTKLIGKKLENVVTSFRERSIAIFFGFFLLKMDSWTSTNESMQFKNIFSWIKTWYRIQALLERTFCLH